MFWKSYSSYNFFFFPLNFLEGLLQKWLSGPAPPKGKHRRRRTSGDALEGQLRLCSSSTQMMPNVVLVMSMSTNFIGHSLC